MKRLKNVLCTHPILDLEINKALGTKLYTDKGKQIVDFTSGMWCTALGHGNPKINKAIREQIDISVNTHYKLTSNTADRLRKNLLNISKLERGHFIDISPNENILRFFPPLTISEDEISSICEDLKDVLENI